MTKVPMKTVIALSKRYDDRPAVQLNAVGHLAQAIGHEARDLAVVEYRTADGGSLGSIGWWPLVLLSGRAPKIEAFWQAARGGANPRACFVETMISGGSELQVAATAGLGAINLPIVAIAIHGPAAELDLMTRKLSLWRPTPCAPAA
ncbi:hypothetical protein GCM10009087_30230 [Sphingomonas oligophenolica]|uniref:DUF2000 family protein n=1 Tax=Sphingomonas oligophenolica TaxID=301154 RepID=A0ABU9Y6H6_9SPHN